MYIDDYIEIVIKLINLDIKNETIDICKSSPVTIKELIHIIYDVANKDRPKINYLGDPTENTNFILSNKKMIDMINITPATDLQVGLKKWISEGLK